MSEIEKTVMMNRGKTGTVVIDRNKDATLPMSATIPSVLIVDDEDLMRDFLEDTLEPTGYKIYIAADYESAKRILSSSSISLIISDINLPHTSGMELLKYVKEVHQNIPVILITGAPDLQAAVQTVKEGAFDYISKPISVDVLLERVQAALDHATSDSHLSLTAIKSIDKEAPTSKYHIIRTLGTGTMGMVMLVDKDGELYAIKIMRSELANYNDFEHLERFKREAEVLSQVNHPNIIKVYEYGIYEKEEVPYIVMEYISGNSLEYQMKHGNFSMDEKINIIKGLAAALGAVHKAGILHRDIKPANILLTEDKQPKLTDFGIARVSNSDLTMTAQSLGTPAYMPPEAFETSREVDERSDIFSLGVVSYELLTGQKPFDGISLADIMHAIRETNPIEPMKINPDIPGYVQDAMDRMLAKDPRERFKNTDLLLDAMELKGEMSNTAIIKSKLLKSLLGKRNTWK